MACVKKVSQNVRKKIKVLYRTVFYALLSSTLLLSRVKRLYEKGLNPLGELKIAPTNLFQIFCSTFFTQKKNFFSFILSSRVTLLNCRQSFSPYQMLDNKLRDVTKIFLRFYIWQNLFKLQSCKLKQQFCNNFELGYYFISSSK